MSPRHRHRFRPTELGRLEDRIALSGAGAVAELAATTPAATFTTTLPRRPGATETSKLSWTVTEDGLKLRFKGTLKENPSVTPSATGLTGSLVVTSLTRHKKGSVTFSLSGPTANLAPAAGTTSTFTINFEPVKDTGIFSHLPGLASGLTGTNTVVYLGIRASRTTVRGTWSAT